MRLLKQMLRVSEGATYSQAGAGAVSFSIRFDGGGTEGRGSSSASTAGIISTVTNRWVVGGWRLGLGGRRVGCVGGIRRGGEDSGEETRCSTVHSREGAK